MGLCHALNVQMICRECKGQCIHAAVHVWGGRQPFAGPEAETWDLNWLVCMLCVATNAV